MDCKHNLRTVFGGRGVLFGLLFAAVMSGQALAAGPMALRIGSGEKSIERYAEYGYTAAILGDATQLATYDEIFPDAIGRQSDQRRHINRQREKFQKEYDRAQALGLAVCLMSDEVSLPIPILERLQRKGAADKLAARIDFDSAEFWNVYRAKYREVLKAYPRVAYVMIRTGENYSHAEDGYMGRTIVAAGKYDEVYFRRMTRLIEETRKIVVDEFGRKLIWRTWDLGNDGFHANPKVYDRVLAGLPERKGLIMAVKHTQTDFWCYNDFNPMIGRGGVEQIVEFQCAREYEGKGAFPNYLGPLFAADMGQAAARGVTGVWLWDFGGGWGGPILQSERWVRLNIEAASQLALNSQASPRALAEAWAAKTFGPKSAANVAEMLMLSGECVRKSMYIEAFARDHRGWKPSLNLLRDDIIRREVLQQLYRGSKASLPEVFREKEEAVALAGRMRNLFESSRGDIIAERGETEYQEALSSLIYLENLTQVLAHYINGMFSFYHWQETRESASAAKARQELRAWREAWQRYQTAVPKLPGAASAYRSQNQTKNPTDGSSPRGAMAELCEAALQALAEQASGPSAADYVKPLIDTHKSRWFFFSSACRPFGMVNLSPDTKVGGDWLNGYLYGETNIQCFSHVHGWQLYGVPVMPQTGELHSHKGLAAAASPFSHADEIVRAGYHKVFLQRYGITAELTSTTRVGFHRYTFPAGEQSFLAFDTSATLMDKMDASAIRQVSPTEIAGFSVMSRTQRRPKPFTVYFVAQFSQPVTFGAWENSRLLADAREVSGKKVGGYVQFKPTAGGPILMKVAISYTSEENAQKNMAAELPGWDFDAVVKASRDDWNDWLGRLEVAGGTEAQRVKFYTDLWHALLGRRIVSDVDGSYCDRTGPQPVTRQVCLDAQGKPRFPHYNFDALWGSQWSLSLLWSFAYPEVMDGFCNTMVDMYRDGGLIPRGSAGGNYTFVMTGDPATPFFAAAYNKGIRGYDAEKAYEGLRKNALPGGIRDHAGYEFGATATGGGMSYYVERGYVPEGIPGKGMHRNGAAMTLEYAYQDWCLAQLATALGKTSDADWLTRRSFNYTNLWDASVKYLRPRNLDGSWLEDFAPVGKKGSFTAKGFTEANSAIYTHAVPQDMPGLIRLFGGKESYVAALDRQFELAEPENFVVPHGEHGGAWVDYDNQPSLEMAHLFNLAGAPWLSQKWARKVKDLAFGDITPEGGYNGDEDQGQLGALGVLLAIGLFDVQGGAATNPTYQITSPLFDRVTLHLNPAYFPGKQFVIQTGNNSAKNVYIQSAKLNGQPLNQFWVPHTALISGGVLELGLGPQPSRWAADSPPIPQGQHPPPVK